jgi:hypothetical protein
MDINTALSTLIFLVIIYSIPFFSILIRSNHLVLSYWVVISLYQIVAFTNAFLVRTLGADMDANSFHVLGVEVNNSGVFQFHSDANLYINILGKFYSMTSNSIIIGSQLSILFIGISIVFFVKILNKLKLNHNQALLIFLYAGLPSMFMLGSITLREPIQVSLLLISFYFGLKMRIDSKYKVFNFCMLVLFALGAGIFHRGVFVFSIFFTFAFLVWNTNEIKIKYKIKVKRLIVLTMTPFLILVFFYLAVNSDISGSNIFEKILNLEVLEAIKNHRTYTPIGRASYDIPFDYSSIFMGIYSSGMIYIHYLFTPFVWNISSLADLYAGSEAILHLILIYYSIRAWLMEKGQRKQLIGLMLILFFVISFIFAVGTTNYGTGIRHKMLSWWLLVIMGGPYLISKIKQFLTKKYSDV